MHQSDSAALGSLGRDVTDKAAVVGAGEAAVSDQRGGLCQTAAIQILHGLVHLAHAGAALGAFVANDYDVAIMDLAGQNCLLSLFLRIEADSLAFKVMQALVKGTGLGDTGVGSQVAPQNGHAAGKAEGIINGADGTAGVGIQILMGCNVLADGMRGDSHLIVIKKFVGHVLHHAHHAAILEEVDDVVVAGRIHLGDLRRRTGEVVKLRQNIDIQLSFVGDGDQVHHSIGGAAHGHAGLDGVADTAIGDDLAGSDLLLHQLHDLDAGFLGQSQAASGGGGGQAGVRERHAHGLSQRAHGVGSAQVRAGTAAGAGGIFQRDILFLGDLAGREHAVGLSAGGLVGFTAVKHLAAFHGAAGQHDAGDIQAGSCHQHTGDDLVAGAQQDQCIKLVDLRHGLHGVGDDLAVGQDVVHTDMAVCHAVAAADHAKFHRGTAGAVDTVTDALCDLPQIEVAGVGLTPGVRNADDGTSQVIRGETHRLVGSTVILIAKTGQKLFAAFHKHSPYVNFKTRAIPGTFLNLVRSIPENCADW